LKICLVGAGGGIGRQLLAAFDAGHSVSAIYRTLPRHAPPNIDAVRFDDGEGLARAARQAEVVVHAALNTKVPGKEFLAANRDVTERLLSLIDPATCRLFVYFSSQVVYAALDPVAHPVQGEDAVLFNQGGLDNYTRLKLIEEERVIAACREKGIGYLIVRPTVVMGPNMQWSSGIVAAMRIAPFGIKGRTFNLIHVEDLGRQLLALIERGVSDEIVNLGDLDVSSADYFRHAASLANRPIFLAPNWLAGAAGRLIPSTLWFLSHNVQVDTQKVRRLSGVSTGRQLADFFVPPPRVVDVRDLDMVRDTLRKGRPYRTFGQGYFLWFNEGQTIDRLVMQNYSGTIRMEGDRLTVRSGTTLRAILDYLAPRGLSLATLPEFVDISAGACFFTEVHGSSSEHISVFDLITAIRYLRGDGEEAFSSSSDPDWEHLRNDGTIVVTEVEFQVCPNRNLANVIEWQPDSQLEGFVNGGYRQNLSTTLHWYPRSREMMVYKVNPTNEALAKDRGPFAPMRGSPAALQRALLRIRLRGRHRIVGPSEQVLAPWTRMPGKKLIGRVLMAARVRLRNMEICVPDACAEAFFARLRANLPDMGLTPGQGIGVRFAGQASTGKGYVWVEITSRNVEQMHALVDMARDVCAGRFWLHRGKYVPPGIGMEHLFIPREPRA